jgi:hypothetical protein
MNKMSCGAVVFIFVLMAASCKSAPAAVDESQDSGDRGSEIELLEIYGNYDGIPIDGITLDGAVEHTVKYGDTLTKIARVYYGEGGGYYFPLIIFASRTVIVDPDKILPGQILIIPDLQRNLDNPIARLQIKSMLLDIAFVYDGKADATRGSLKARNLKDRDGLIALSRAL